MKAALKDGMEAPPRPAAADPGPEPVLPRLAVSDVTVERTAVLVERQPRGVLMARDELAGWLHGMTRYSGGGSDRPFWLEAHGGRSYTVERMSRPPVNIPRLTIGVCGGIQPEPFKTLLIKADDDGLLARFLPLWPNPAPIKRPRDMPNPEFIEQALQRLISLNMLTDEHGVTRPWFIPFSEGAKALLDEFRQAARAWEGEAEGLLQSFIGKLPGMAVRLALMLAYLDWAAEGGEEPHEIHVGHFARAAHLVENYLLPMARRAYADASLPAETRAARRLLAIIREHGWKIFAARDVQRLGRMGLQKASDIRPILAALEEGDIIRRVDASPSSKGGRPGRAYIVSPAVLEGGQ